MWFGVTGWGNECLVFVYFWPHRTDNLQPCPHTPFDEFHRKVDSTFSRWTFSPTATSLFHPLCFRREEEGLYSVCVYDIIKPQQCLKLFPLLSTSEGNLAKWGAPPNFCFIWTEEDWIFHVRSSTWTWFCGQGWKSSQSWGCVFYHWVKGCLAFNFRWQDSAGETATDTW